MNLALWIVQLSLAMVFATSGTLKAFASKPWLVASGQTGVSDYGIRFIRFIALCELAGAIGLTVPGLTGIAPFLTPLAAAGLGIIMIGAASSHRRLARADASRRRKELRNAANAAVLFLLCAAVVIGRGLLRVE